jgi:hypothetical protein
MTKILSNKSNIDLDYPICRPSLDLDFTQEVLDPRITFSRGSIGTRVNRNRLIETVSANQPRFDYDPVTGECKGLLIEETRTNLLVNSDDFNSWAKNNYNVNTNVITAPDGTLTADKIIPINSNTFHDIFKTPSLSSNTYTLSIFAKAAEQSFIRLRIDDSVVSRVTMFNLSNGSIGSSVNVTSSTITPYPNGWYRCSITVTTNIINVVFNSFPTSSAVSYTGDGTLGIYVWGAQIEQGAFPTSYIPTTASIVPRSADLAQMTGTNFSSWYNSTEGTVYSNTRMNGVQNRYDRLWAITNSNLHLEGISVYVAGPVSSGGYVSSITITNSATEQINGAIVESATTTPKLRSAFAFKTNDCASAYNGILRFVDKSAILLSNPDRLLIGQPQRFQGTSCMTISRLTYYPRALKPNQLQYLTQ